MIIHCYKPESTAEQVTSLCNEAIKYQFASVCVNSGFVKLCGRILKNTGVNICSVVGFPIGANLPEVKAFEAECAIQNGASEIDMVMNIGALKSADLSLVARDIYAVVKSSHPYGALAKVIIETALLSHNEKITACMLAKETGADFVKTCTGFAGGSATVEDIQLMRAVINPEMGVKASGGVRSLAKLEEMVAAGANRIGATVGVRIMQELADSSQL